VLDREGVFAAASFERFEGTACRFFYLMAVYRSGGILFCINGGVLAGTLAEYDQV
jgi:hypothetical protein